MRYVDPPFVYFLRPVGADGPVKIGVSTAPESRLRTYMPWSPFPLEIVATLPGAHDLEAAFHAAFADQRTHHEWFSASPALTALIDRIARGDFTRADVPPPSGAYDGRRKSPWTPEQHLSVRQHAALRKLSRNGVEVPDFVEGAARRYALWGSAYGPVKRTPEDAMIVLTFLANHLADHKARARIAEAARACGYYQVAAA